MPRRFCASHPVQTTQRRCFTVYGFSPLYQASLKRFSQSYSTFPYHIKCSRNQGEKWSNGFQRQFPYNSPTS